ncbi:MAG: cache domain-containing protein, partial [Candidatus Thiodiazotropha sp.]
MAAIRGDVREMLSDPQNRSTISVGHFDMTFKSMVPLFDKGHFSGFIEVITHFNSIAKHIEAKDNRVVILVDPKYRKQLTHPFTGLFVGDRYVANRDADPELLSSIVSRGFARFTDPHSDFVIDQKSSSLVINHPLFDTAGEPMANILIFRPLKLVGQGVSSIENTVNLIMLIAILVVAAVLLLIESRNPEGRISGNLLEKSLFISAFVVTSALYIGLLQVFKHDKETEYLNSHNQDLVSHFRFVKNKFRSIADLVYQNDLNTLEIQELIAKAYEGPAAKKQARQKLLDTLIPVYTQLKNYNLRQLHFHLKDNESFLRFHRPGKHGDNLTGIRSTVEWVNLNHSPIEGFEEGRIYNGYRFVFPLFRVNADNERRHIGSVEISFSAFALLDEIISESEAKGGFLIRKDVVHSKVFKLEVSNYSTSAFPGYLQEDSIEEQLHHYFKHIEAEYLSEAQIKDTSLRILDGEIFTIISDDKKELFSFIPLKNPVTRKVVATLIQQTDDKF